MGRSKVLGPAAIVAGIAGLVATVVPQAVGAQETFDSPDAAMSALLGALAAQGQAALLEIFGAEHEAEILGDDPDAASEEQARFLAAAERSLELRPDGDDRRIAYVGLRATPFAIPIVLDEGGWHFDTEAGIDELANQRIGGNELRTIETMRAYVDAQNDYASEDRDGDEVLEYAQQIRSSPGQHDGLYWPDVAGQPESPIGPLLAAAVETHDVGESFNGYYYRILTRQGANPPGGAYDYVINGNMIAGFGLIAWPPTTTTRGS